MPSKVLTTKPKFLIPFFKWGISFSSTKVPVVKTKSLLLPKGLHNFTDGWYRADMVRLAWCGWRGIDDVIMMALIHKCAWAWRIKWTCEQTFLIHEAIRNNQGSLHVLAKIVQFLTFYLFIFFFCVFIHTSLRNIYYR